MDTSTLSRVDSAETRVFLLLLVGCVARGNSPGLLRQYYPPQSCGAMKEVKGLRLLAHWFSVHSFTTFGDPGGLFGTLASCPLQGSLSFGVTKGKGCHARQHVDFYPGGLAPRHHFLMIGPASHLAFLVSSHPQGPVDGAPTGLPLRCTCGNWETCPCTCPAV